MCHVITYVTANHRLSSRTVRVFPVRRSLNTHTLTMTVNGCQDSTTTYLAVSRYFSSVMVCVSAKAS